MNKFAALIALVTVSAAISAPASAATAVRVSLANKTPAQIGAEIQSAARTVCAADRDTSAECVTNTINDANHRLNVILKASATSKAAPRREAVSVVRVSVKGKTTEQIHAEIKIAAETVCKSSHGFTNRIEYQACVGETVRSAKAQLQALNAAQPKQLAAL